MDNSGKITWAKHNEIQTVNIKSVGADFEVTDGERLPLAVKEMGTCDLYPQIYGALRMFVKMHLMWNSKILIDGGDNEIVATSLLEASNLLVLKAAPVEWIDIGFQATVEN
ncbi:coatomer subunit beta'-1-like isoform X2 [Cucumis melo]|uniref:Coatomer subunit beta'-1-like isoform X2 n=1 Tax=Cucumis melo TaxID=3656 RepID=A0ABM3KC18_CUCME|nr:coatomer subunit beta'-1-like isoform X2 [Cucumis melo]